MILEFRTLDELLAFRKKLKERPDIQKEMIEPRELYGMYSRNYLTVEQEAWVCRNVRSSCILEDERTYNIVFDDSPPKKLKTEEDKNPESYVYIVWEGIWHDGWIRFASLDKNKADEQYDALQTKAKYLLRVNLDDLECGDTVIKQFIDY
jgi:hypothetical protein